MTHGLDRRLERLEDQKPKENRPYAIMPEPCKTTEEWIARCKQQVEGRGQYELMPLKPGSNVRFQRWVPEQLPSSRMAYDGAQIVPADNPLPNKSSQQ